MKLQKDDLNYFLGKTFFDDDGSQTLFVYQPTINTLLLEDNGTDYISNWKSKGIYNFKR